MSDTLLSDDMLKTVIKKSCEQELANLDEQIKQNGSHIFSKDFLIKMDALRKEKRRRERAKRWPQKISLRYVLITALLLALSTATVAASEQIQKFLYHVYITLFSDHAELEHKKEQSKETAVQFIPYEPVYLPEGYEITYDDIDPQMGMHYITYERGDDILVFSQNTIGMGESSVTSNGETLEELEIQENKAIYTTDGTYQSIIYEMDGFIFCITGPLQKDVLIRVAESVLAAD